MKKGLIIKLTIVLVVLALSYCVFWFFKAGQSEKQINKFISDNSANVSAGEISVSGFPISQKIIINDLKITVPVNVISKRQIYIKKLEASSSIFSNDFLVALVDGVKVQDSENAGEVFEVEFVNQPEIKVSLNNGIISKFSYNDLGFKVLDANKNVVNSSTGSSITSETSVDETEKKVSKIHISFKELEGYTVADFYKNVLEKKVIEGIKTEEIKVNNVVVNQEVAVDTVAGADIVGIDKNKNTAEAKVALADASDKDSKVGGKKSSQGKAKKSDKDKSAKSQNPSPIANDSAQVAIAPSEKPSKNGVEAAKKAMEMANNIPQNGGDNPQVGSNASGADSQVNNQDQVAGDANNVATDPSSPVVNNLPEASVANSNAPDSISDSSIVKSNVNIDIVVTITPSVKQESEAPSDPTQIQELPVQYVQNIKIENLEFSNPLYKISVAGDVLNSSDDNLPSGGITVKVEKIANLLQQLKSQFKKMAELKKSSTSPAVASDVNAPVVADGVNDVNANVAQVPNYDIFLTNVSEKISGIALEIAGKNSVSKDELSQFDVRREKNLEFLVNEVPVREIIGKF